MSGEVPDAGWLPARLNRPPFNSPWVAATLSRFGLPVWFGTESILGVGVAAQDTKYLFFDARLYLDATRAWLAGGNPWDVQIAGNYFAAPPPSLLPFVPIAMLPPDLGVAIVALGVAGAAVATVRLLGLPWWWLLFPPLVQCVLSANVHALIVPLILARGGGFAVIAKIYAAVPLAILGRWRSLVAAAILLGITLPVLPWALFIADLGLIAGRLETQTRLAVPIVLLLLLSPLVLAALAVVGRERAAWLAASALWPSQQFYYGTLVMPAKSKIAAAIVALPIPGNGLLALFVLALVTARARASRRSGRPG